MNQTLETIQNLRSIHGNFSEREISEQDLKTIIEASLRAANASARQGYSVIVVEDREKMKKLCGYAGSKGLVFCADLTRMTAIANHLNHLFDADGVPQFMTSAVDAVLVAQTAVIAAKSLGIDSLITNGIHRGDMERVFTLLNLPEKHCFPVIMVVLGYPTDEPDHRQERWNGAGVVHYGAYHPLTTEQTEEMVRKYDDPEAHLGLSDTWKPKGLAHYWDWFFTVWVGRFGKATGKTQMAQILERIGFLFP